MGDTWRRRFLVKVIFVSSRVGSMPSQQSADMTGGSRDSASDKQREYKDVSTLKKVLTGSVPLICQMIERGKVSSCEEFSEQQVHHVSLCTQRMFYYLHSH